MPPSATQAHVPTARLEGQGSEPRPGTLVPTFCLLLPSLLPSPLSSIACSANTGNPRRGPGLWALVPALSLLPGAYLYAEGIRRNLLWLIPGRCWRPRSALRRQRAVGKIRTGPSATPLALVTLQAAGIQIIFIYNLFDHPASNGGPPCVTAATQTAQLFGRGGGAAEDSPA